MNTRTFLLLAALTALFMAVGYMIAGGSGAFIAFLVAGAMNLFAYWNSDSLVLRTYGAREIGPESAPELHALVARLAARAGIPMPRVYLIEQEQPNAFATGRDPAHGAVAVTSGILRLLSQAELAGVLAHELGHIRHRDTLTMTVTATIAGAIGMLSQFAFFLGSGNRRDNPLGLVGTLLVTLLAPVIAMIVQFAISRSREYEADRAGAEISGQPEALASALRKIEAYARGIPNLDAERNPAMAHVFIVNPLAGRGADSLFSTHPSTENRIARLLAISGGAAYNQDIRPLGTRPAPATGSTPSAGQRRRTRPWG